MTLGPEAQSRGMMAVPVIAENDLGALCLDDIDDDLSLQPGKEGQAQAKVSGLSISQVKGRSQGPSLKDLLSLPPVPGLDFAVTLCMLPSVVIVQPP